MKTLFKFRTLMLILLGVLAFACKKNENNTNSEYSSETDSVNMSVDTVGPAIDSSATLNSDQHGENGTTGATGEGSTGSGTDGST
ncbi:hypothetical protein OD917_09010 [Flavobacterium sp. SH_e]|uniref:hypothetical protein n=1 Tax=Flavobacterium TaxID=237 RepID=UPI0021E4191D|nr:hypothetical protein [Flavobacterium sp. SH_e]MCV2485060.1 hypothetical protein [Flavobacterium sp. SH_e]